MYNKVVSDLVTSWDFNFKNILLVSVSITTRIRLSIPQWRLRLETTEVYDCNELNDVWDSILFSELCFWIIT